MSAGSPPQTPLGELTALPQTHSWILLAYFEVREGERGEGKGGEGRREVRKKKSGRRSRGGGRESVPLDLIYFNLTTDYSPASTPVTMSKHSESNIVECYKSYDSFEQNSLNLFRQNRNKLNMQLNLFRPCRQDEISRKTRSTLLPKTAKMSKQHSTL